MFEGYAVDQINPCVLEWWFECHSMVGRPLSLQGYLSSVAHIGDHFHHTHGEASPKLSKQNSGVAVGTLKDPLRAFT